MNVLKHLEDIESKYSRGVANPLMVKNATYHLCMEDRFLSVFMDLWMRYYKPCAFSIRNAKDDIYGSIVVSIKDTNGEMIEFIKKVVTQTSARVHITKKL